MSHVSALLKYHWKCWNQPGSLVMVEKEQVKVCFLFSTISFFITKVLLKQQSMLRVWIVFVFQY